MKLSSLSQRLGGEGAAAWDLHFQALEAAKSGKDIIVMSVGDSDYDTPAPIVETCVAALRSGDTHYSPVAGSEKFRNAVATRHQAATGTTCALENVTICAGTQNALFNAAMIALSPGDEVVVLEPMYVTYEATFRASGATIVPVPCPAGNDFRPDLDVLQAAITNKTNLIAFASPVNPTGAVFPRSDLEAIAQAACQHDLWVISDEVYADLIFDGNHISIASLAGMSERTITVSSLSKSHAMPGWRAGWAIAPEPFTNELQKLMLCSTYGLPGFIQQAAAFALENDLDEVDNIRDGLQHRRDLACRILEECAYLKFQIPQAGMFLVIDVQETGLTSAEFAERLYRKEGVSVMDGSTFGPSTVGTIRVSFAMSDEILSDGYNRIVQFANSLV